MMNVGNLKMSRNLFAALALIAGLSATSAVAQTSPVVVELFTSQGCSSCPPADELVRKLSARDDVLPLALHVDYWDYLGWKDMFADPAHTARQKAYASVGGRKMIYTPQMVVMGQEDVVGADAMALADLIMSHRAKAPVLRVAADRTGATLTIDLAPLQTLSGPLDIHVMRFSPKEQVDVRRGENAGRTLHFANVVRHWRRIGQWDGKEEAQFTVDLSDDVPTDLPLAVLVQHQRNGPIVGAAVAR